MTCGIYLLDFNNTDKVYIGQSTNIERRFNRHCSELKAQTHSKKMNKAYLLYGLPNIEILEICDEESLNILEDYHITLWDSVRNGFNTECDQSYTRDTITDVKKNSAYTKEQIIHVLDLLIDPIIHRFSYIEATTSVKLNTIRSISAGLTHIWLKNLYPDKYSLLLNLKGKREIGINSPQSKHSEDCIVQIFNYIIDKPTTPYKDKSEIFNVSLAVVAFIANGTTHLWLRDRFPEKYALLETLKGTRSGGTVESRGIKIPNILSPDGVEYKVTNIRQFSREHNIPYTSLSYLLHGKSKQAKGWTVTIN